LSGLAKSVPGEVSRQRREKEVVMTATYDDANLLVQLMRWGTDVKLEEALSHIFEEDFDPEKEPMDSPEVRVILFWGETVGALVKHNVLNKDLLRDVLWIDGVWPRVKHHALAAREGSNEPTLYENFEALVTPSVR
jgi:hypothetical protein